MKQARALFLYLLIFVTGIDLDRVCRHRFVRFLRCLFILSYRRFRKLQHDLEATLLSPQTFRDPISGTVLITLALTAAFSAGSYVLQRLLAPKPQGQVQGKLYGNMQISDSSWNLFIPEIYGAPLNADESGGIRVGVNVIWATPIREHRTTVPGSGGGGRKGAPEPPPDTRITYDIDFAALVGRGPLEILQIKANEDVLYNAFAAISPTNGTEYEAEDVGNTLAGGAAVTADGACSGGYKVTGLGSGGSIIFNDVIGYGRQPIQIFYKCTGDKQLYVKINGSAPNLVIFPDSGGAVASKLIMRTLEESIGNTIEFYNDAAAGPDLDYILVADPIDIQPHDDGSGGIGPIGHYDADFPAETAYDHFMPPDPKQEDTNAWERYNRPAVEVDGVTNITLSNGAACTIYEGNFTQLPDALISADIDTKYGSGSTPAYRGRCYIVFQNFDITKYGTMPNLTVVAAHKTIKTMKQMLEDRATRSGVDIADLDFDACSTTKLRGYGIAQVQAVSKDMEDLAKWYNFAFIENFDGKIEAKDLSSRTIAATLIEADLGAYVLNDEQMPNALVETQVPEITDLPETYRVGFFNSQKDYQSDEREDKEQNTRSVKVISDTFPITAWPDEAKLVAQRLMQKTLHEADPHTIALQHRFAYLQAADRIYVPVDGENRALRISEITGAVPGTLKLSLVNDELTVFAGQTPASLRKPKRYPVNIPVNTFFTICDVPRLRENDNVPGVYVFATPRDLVNGVWNGATLYRDKGEGYQQMTVFDAPCTVGRCVDQLGDLPLGYVSGDWDTDSEVTIDLFCGSLESSTDAQVLDGANLFIIGDEVIGAVNCVRDSNYPNRWTLSRLQRQIKKSDATTHTAGERACFLNSASRFVALDLTEKSVERNYKCVTFKQNLADAAPVAFTWGGKTETSMPAYDVIDADVPTVSTAPTIKRNDQLQIAQWTVYIPRPSDYGFTADNVEIRFRDRDNTTQLNGGINNSVTTITVDDTSLFPSSGKITIDNETISYSGKTSTTFTGCTRGVDGTTAASHADNAVVKSVVRQLQIGNTTVLPQPMFAYDCDVDYRWRNRYRQSGSDGWSSWSTSAIAYGLNKAATTQNAPDSELVSFSNDASDVSQAETRKTLY